MGHEVPAKDVERILRRLGFGLTPARTSAERRNDYIVTLPSWRLDVEKEIDLIEEVARVYGYNRFPSTLPAFSGAAQEAPEAEKDAHLRSTLLALGYNEAVSTSFVSRADAAAFSSAAPVELENPINAELEVMRTSLLPGMLEMLAYNLNRGASNVRLFENGNIHESEGGQCHERRQLCLGATGSARGDGGSVHEPERAYSFFDMKGDVEEFLHGFEHDCLHFDAETDPHYHPGRSARALMDGEQIARFGQLHPEFASARKLKQDVYVAEVFLDVLYRRALRQPRYRAASRFPAVLRDFSFVFDNQVRFGPIEAAVQELNIAELRSLQPVETFRGDEKKAGSILAGKYSILLRATFQSDDRTLRDDEVAHWSGRIIKALEALGGSLRA